MDFYFATYIKQQCSRHGWKDIRRNQKIIVLADNMEEAVQKIDSCLKRRNNEIRNNGIYNYVLRSKVIKCDAIDVQEMEDEMFEIFPIMSAEKNNCKCGSDRLLRCKDHTVFPYKYWIECMNCGFIGGLIRSKQKFSIRAILQDGTEIIKSPENDSVDLWNREVESED